MARDPYNQREDERAREDDEDRARREREQRERHEPPPCPKCGGRGWHTAGGNDPMACSCPAGEAWSS